MTEPPPRNTFSSNVSQWEIFDAYQQDYELTVIFPEFLIQILVSLKNNF